MTGVPARAAATRGWLALFGAAGLAVAIPACEAPPHALRKDCSGMTFGTETSRDCTLAIARFDRTVFANLPVDSRRRLALVQGHFSVQQGTVRVSLHGSTGTAAEFVVGPGRPGSIDTTLRLDRRNGFRLRFEPDGEASGLDAKLHYEAR
ncbi:hypothetical protein MNQ95_04045 [Pseudoxanthomonas daejeonensis]|uniref:hypothetical protein n=1 Tax=Pseudoxanthomonas daejeonensis TaxID=266062 RepID=UPI001F541633|nr:hypothetical protein [Pseudoxanthomonas daejeonensis]UNK58283.1 hypothetical protein MNQ95_04045 [Pseudoxanthomonas daejeonensis]